VRRAVVLVLAVLATAAPAPARRRAPTNLLPATIHSAQPSRVYVRSIPDRTTFEAYSKVLGTDRYAKFIIDIKSGDIYFIDVNLFRIHADFVLGVLLKQEWTAENVRAYNRNYERVKPQFVLGYLTEHLKIGKTTFAFWEGDQIDARGIAMVHQKLNQTFYLKNLAFRPDSPAQEQVARAVGKLGIQTITNDAIYKAADYQSLNNGEAVGRLRVVPQGTPYESLLFDRGDIVILQEPYPDISPVAGILSTRSSTPLSHVNLRARAWSIPNASFHDAYGKYAALDGKVVYFRVADTSHDLREATAEEEAQFANHRQEKRRIRVPKADLGTARMPMLTRIHANQARMFGAKTANLGEIASARIPGVDIPEGFGIPFHYYVRHIGQHGIDHRIKEMLADPRWSDATWRKGVLEEVRAAIIDAPLEADVLDAIYKRVRVKLGGRGVFVRSSTNAEDLEGFNGAGLYDTVPHVRGKANLEKAIKTVWASLWNYRAVAERELYGIAHGDTYPGVLVQVGVNATAAGVLVTTNLFDEGETDIFTINAKWGLGLRVVQGNRIPEQIMYDTGNHGTKIVSRSDDPVMLVFDGSGGIREVPSSHDGVILSETRARHLADTVESFIHLFPPTYPLDVEWLLEGERIWIVQARPYVGGR